jgi:hypothetical protein
VERRSMKLGRKIRHVTRTPSLTNFGGSITNEAIGFAF